MTAYSAIANSEIAVGAPLTNSLMTKNRDNPLAIQENDASAPTIAYATTAGSATTAGTITGQGALATLNSVTAEQINDDAVRMSEIYTTIGSYAAPNISPSSIWSAPEDGIFFLKTTTASILLYEMFFNGVWTSTGRYVSNSNTNHFLIISGSTRIRNTSGSNITLNYQRVMG